MSKQSNQELEDAIVDRAMAKIRHQPNEVHNGVDCPGCELALPMSDPRHKQATEVRVCQRGVDASEGCGHPQSSGLWHGFCQFRGSQDVVRDRVCGHRCSFEVRVPDERQLEFDRHKESCPECRNAKGSLTMCETGIDLWMRRGQPRDAACHAAEPPKEGERFHAISQLISVRSEESQLRVRTALCDESPLVRHEAAFVLGHIGEQSDADLLLDCLSDPSAFVRHETLLAIAELGDAHHADILKPMLNDPVPEVAASAKIAIEKLSAASSTQPNAAGDSAEVRHLLQCLAEEHSESAVAISKCLRFGMLDDFTGDQAINHVVLEHNDVLTVIELLAEHGVVISRVDDLIQKKKEKLAKMMAYAREKGML